MTAGTAQQKPARARGNMVSIQLDGEVYRAVKNYTAQNNVTMKDLFTCAILEEMRKRSSTINGDNLPKQRFEVGFFIENAGIRKSIVKAESEEEAAARISRAYSSKDPKIISANPLGPLPAVTGG